ncbi:MAG TPA: hypothetical protein VHF08_04740 [Nitrososphaeraceae archaeon]|nr:hypothetical protein [Nitrososphaeraceae archaeon]
MVNGNAFENMTSKITIVTRFYSRTSIGVQAKEEVIALQPEYKFTSHKKDDSSADAKSHYNRNGRICNYSFYLCYIISNIFFKWSYILVIIITDIFFNIMRDFLNSLESNTFY